MSGNLLELKAAVARLKQLNKELLDANENVLRVPRKQRITAKAKATRRMRSLVTPGRP